MVITISIPLVVFSLHCFLAMMVHIKTISKQDVQAGPAHPFLAWGDNMFLAVFLWKTKELTRTQSHNPPSSNCDLVILKLLYIPQMTWVFFLSNHYSKNSDNEALLKLTFYYFILGLLSGTQTYLSNKQKPVYIAKTTSPTKHCCRVNLVMAESRTAHTIAENSCAACPFWSNGK